MEAISNKTNFFSKAKKVITKKQFYLYILPWLIALICFTLIPMIVSFILSFTSAKASTITTKPLKFIKLLNYTDIFTTDHLFWRSVLNSFVYAILKVLVTIVFSFIIALLLNKNGKYYKLKNFYRVLIYLPAVIPAVASALLWQLLICQDKSLIVNLLSKLGLGKIDFRNSATAMISVVLINSLGAIGPWMIVILSALQNVSNDLLDAANVDGAKKFQVLLNVIIPSISPSLFFLLSTGFINTLQAYTEITLLFGDNYNTYTMTMCIMQNAFNGAGMGYACAMAWICFVIISIFTFIFFKTIGKKVYYGS